MTQPYAIADIRMARPIKQLFYILKAADGYPTLVRDRDRHGSIHAVLQRRILGDHALKILDYARFW